MLLGVVETIVGVGFIHCLFDLLVVGDCSCSNDPHLPLPEVNVSTYFSLKAKC